ncbi:MAG: mechanosensitive ion channel [Lachnospiraceae bacterium]|nr:mechanosensitive ion channel [Lachnospiraceae bacterium]
MNEGMLKSWLNNTLPEVMSFFWCVILALLVFVIGRKVIGAFIKVTEKAMTKRRTERGVQTFLLSLLKGLLYVVMILIILGLFGVQTSSVAAAVAALGLTAGLSLQGSLSNLAGGVLILLLHPFKVGDYIKEDSHGNEGAVSEITIFYTKLKTIDNKIVVIPNGALANSSLTNYTKSDRRQMDLTFGISYDSDIKKAKDILRNLAEQEERRLQDEAIRVFVRELADSSVNLGLRFWVPTGEYWNVRWDLTENVKYRFDEAGIEIPFNQMDVHMK